MDYQLLTALDRYKSEVGIKFQLYNSLFTSLPFHRIEKTGILLAMFLSSCEEGYEKEKSPVEIIDDFCKRLTSVTGEEEKIDLMFRFVQYVERQVVLFDALEDAAFTQLNDTGGAGTMKNLQAQAQQLNNEDVLAELLQHFAIRLVLTAHPTQFYPGEVLGIIHDLSRALHDDNTAQVNMYLQQLGKTPFLKQQKPTPYDEAVSLIWFLENVFYPAAGRILTYMKRQMPYVMQVNKAPIRLGFWPGGDRDGNPFVKTDTTLRVARALHTGVLKCYYLEVRRLRRRLTFKGVVQPLLQLEQMLYQVVFIPHATNNITTEMLLDPLRQVRQTLKQQHNGLFIQLVEGLINKVEIFGVFFASLDMRQDSSIHVQLYQELAAQGGILPADYLQANEEGKLHALFSLAPLQHDVKLSDDVLQDMLMVPTAVREIQQANGEEGCNRYIISQCNSAVNVAEVFGLFLLAGWKTEDLTVDIVPLFETIDDLKQAAGIMRTLYSFEPYAKHLQRRGSIQTIMLGFSDGTKDGGYLMANWSIYKAKEELTALSRSFNVDVIFFDGRGGPPARGGGKTHRFYSSMGQNISNREIQLTIQGQTISSNFGTIDSAQFNMEQLLHAGLANRLQSSRITTLSKQEEQTIQELSELGYKSYNELKNHPQFVSYLSSASPLRFYADTNIGSRPAKRKASAKLQLKDLRAIPYVGAWSQIKQNVTGYYGVGTALQKMEQEGRWNEVKHLYDNSAFIRALMDNCEMAMQKSHFPLTAYLSKHSVYGKVWQMIYEEYKLSRMMLLKLTGKPDLMDNYPMEKLSIQMRERIVLPITTIQQYGLSKLRHMEEQVMESPLRSKYEKLVMRCSFGIINAGRNSA